MQVESIIFDVDGTLWDSVDLVAESWNAALAELGLPAHCTRANIQGLFGKTMAEIAGALAPGEPPQRAAQVMQRCSQRELEYLRSHPCRIFYPGVEETLPELASRFRLFIVSNCQQGYIEILLDKGNLRPLIRDYDCFGNTGTCKGETIRTLMRRNHIVRACYVGDTQGDLEAARMAGLPFVWAAYGLGHPAQFDAQIHAFPDLLQLLQPMGQ